MIQVLQVIIPVIILVIIPVNPSHPYLIGQQQPSFLGTKAKARSKRGTASFPFYFIAHFQASESGRSSFDRKVSSLFCIL